MDYQPDYSSRYLVEGYPELEQKAIAKFLASLQRRHDHRPQLRRVLTYLGRLIEMARVKQVLVIGCGPIPTTVKYFVDEGFDVHGVEPVPGFVTSAAEDLGQEGIVVRGAAESIPFEDESQQLVFMESVLEHVESPTRSMEEAFRVLQPGGICYVGTTNRHLFRILGTNGEFNVRYFNWLPRLLQECYVFDHLHYRPRLANFTQRPAVHWFSFGDLCRLGREAGFAQFYSLLDLLRPEDERVSRSWLRRRTLMLVQRSPWLRALALTQCGHTIIMWKRRD